MHRILRSSLSVALLATSVFASACNESTDPGPSAPTALAATATGSGSVHLTFTGSGRPGDRYRVERATGAGSTTFTTITTIDGSTSTSMSVDDVGLESETAYRYRVATVRGTQLSAFSPAVDVTTAALGAAGVVVIDQDITANRTLFPDTTYVLRGFIHVKAPAILTIQPGTTIKGDYDVQGSSLFVLPGARIEAVGTAAQPIVFTSSRDVGQRAPGDWGGLVLVGRGIINRAGTVDVEGTGTVLGTPSGQNYAVRYSGGGDNADNSGELRYVRVEFAGYAIATGAELNSFTFAAVGSGTRLSYLQALQGLDDSYEWFGGAADADHLVSYDSGDDHFDMSEGYQGRIQFAIAYQDSVFAPARASAGGISGDPTGVENDGCAAPSDATPCTNGFDATPFTIPVFANFTLVGSPYQSGARGMVLRRGAGGYYVNGIVARWTASGLSIRNTETLERAGGQSNPDLATTDLLLRNILVAETPLLFDAGADRQAYDAAANSVTLVGDATLAGLFTSVPANASASTTGASFDWTPAAGSAAATAGWATFSGRLATRVATPLASGNGTVAGTAYAGAAAPGGPRWWAGWTTYAQR